MHDVPGGGEWGAVTRGGKRRTDASSCAQVLLSPCRTTSTEDSPLYVAPSIDRTVQPPEHTAQHLLSPSARTARS